LVSLSDLSLRITGWLRKRHIKKFLPTLLKLLQPEKEDIILDVGAGTGVIADEVSKYCEEVFALDPDPKRIEYIKKRYPQIKAFDGTAEAIQFPEFYFTKVYAVSSFHHFKDPETAIYEAYRILKHGGLLVVKESDPEIDKSKFERKISSVNFFKSNSLKEMLEDSGFEVKEFKEIGGDYFISARKA
jgi:ubiquinone/menaquinone biosynthesis C-methylase UbiE